MWRQLWESNLGSSILGEHTRHCVIPPSLREQVICVIPLPLDKKSLRGVIECENNYAQNTENAHRNTKWLPNKKNLKTSIYCKIFLFFWKDGVEEGCLILI